MASRRCLPASRNVEESIEKAIALIQSYTEADWRQTPEQTLESLIASRDEITKHWDLLQKEMVETESNKTTGDVSASEQQILVAFVDMITDAFGDMLQEMQAENVDIEALVDCLQSGLDLINAKNIADFAWGDDDEYCDTDDTMVVDGRESTVTPHEYRRRALGFSLEEASA